MIPSRNARETVEIVELTSLVSSEVESKVPTRWERKQQEQMLQQGTPRKRYVATENSCSPAKSPSTHRKENKSFNQLNVTSARKQQQQTTQTNVAPRGMIGTPSGTDRFIPARSALDFDNASFTARSSITLDLEEGDTTGCNSSTQEFNRVLQANMGADTNSRILHYKAKAPAPVRNGADGLFDNPVSVLYSQQSRKAFGAQLPAAMPTRTVPSTASKILDAPGLLDDFYINPVDWSCANQLAVGLGPLVYLWTAATSSIHTLMEMEGVDETSSDHISSVKFVQEGGGHIAIGSTDKTIGIWDVETSTRLRSMTGHSSRVTALAWNKHILTSGGRDTTIFHHDVRMQNHIVATLKDGHASEVCSLRWNEDGNTLATGGNDNLVCVWDARGGELGDRPRLRLTQHTAAVKAMAWCPYQRNVLATGGGTSDRTIKIWGTVNGSCEQSIDTGSQVCSIVFNPHEKELLSSHGFSNCELTLWKFPTMGKIKDLTGHTNRVLHTVVSPDGSSVCSAAADETLRFWDVFGLPRKKEAAKAGQTRLGMDIR